MPKLTDKTELGGLSQLTDEMHVVRAGVSWRMKLSTLFNNSRFQIRRTSGTKEFIIFRKDATEAVSTVLSVGDVLIYVDTATENLIVGMALDEVSAYPTDLLDPDKFMRFIDTNAML